MVSIRPSKSIRGYSTTVWDREYIYGMVGSTKDLKRRMSQHQEGIGSNYTSKRLPVKLVYCEEYDRVDEAFYREKQVQGWTRRKREALINGTPELLPALAKKVFDRSKIKDNSVIDDASVVE